MDKFFKKCSVDFDRLLAFGFKFNGEEYRYETNFMSNNFRACIKINKNGQIFEEVIDNENNEIYYPLKVKNSAGAYIGLVKNEYEKILENIKNHCFTENLFIYPQSNRIAELIYKKYENSPVFMWDDAPGFGVFKNPKNNKWYGIVMNIDYSKLVKSKKGEIEIINIKLNKDTIQELLTKKGFYPAWHMNKKNWISIILDETLPDKKIMEYIEESHSYT